MSDVRLAKWKPGVIDAPWKKRVVFAERETAIRTINGLGTILFGAAIPGASVTDFVAQCDVLRKLSSEQIADQLIAYWRVVSQQLESSKDISTIDPVPDFGDVGTEAGS